ncbi:MAG: regulatory YrvL family protein [Lachnospiraceae bacterium]
MKEFWHKYNERIVIFFLFGILFIIIIVITALLGGVVMKIFGFQYKSVGSIILFFLIAAILSCPLNLIAETLPKVLLSLKKLPKQSAVFLYIILDTISTSLGLSIVDYFMDNVSATDISIIIISFLLSLFGIKDIDKKPDV